MTVDLRAKIRAVPDFPEPGILFRDVTPLLADPEALAFVGAELVRPFAADRVDAVAGIDARGFVFGALAARELATGFVPIRKGGKLPYRTLSESYELEYGDGTLEMHADAISPGTRVLVVDDLIATGGTAAATCALIERARGDVVGLSFVIELEALGGRDKLAGHVVHAVVGY